MDTMLFGIHANVLLSILYQIIACLMILTGLWLFFRNKITNIFRVRRNKVRGIPTLKTTQWIGDTKEKNKINHHLEMLLRSTKKSYTEHTLSNFYFKTVATFFITVLLMYKLIHDISTSIVAAILVSSIHYVILWVKINRIRAETSHALLPAANLLLQKYRSNNENIYYALRDLIIELEGPIKESFQVILNSIQRRQEIHQSVNLFHYQIKTFFSLQVAILILEGVKENKEIGNALERVIRDMTNNSITLENEKSENRDLIQLGYFPIFAIPITILFNQSITGGRAFYFYFQNPQGLKTLIFTIIICTFSFMVALTMSKQRNDF